jgi:hypothetical protein
VDVIFRIVSVASSTAIWAPLVFGFQVRFDGDDACDAATLQVGLFGRKLHEREWTATDVAPLRLLVRTWAATALVAAVLAGIGCCWSNRDLAWVGFGAQVASACLFALILRTGRRR